MKRMLCELGTWKEKLFAVLSLFLVGLGFLLSSINPFDLVLSLLEDDPSMLREISSI